MILTKNDREKENEEDDINEEDNKNKIFSIKSERNSVNYINTERIINDSKIKTKVEKKNKGKNVKIKDIKKTERTKKKSFDRSITFKKPISLSPEKRIPKRKKNNIGLNIVNIWKGIRKEMNTNVNY